MANISITNYCNLQCPYCFASDHINENKYFIDMDQFNRILNFIKTDDAKIGLIGGEPTLHPHLEEILIRLNEYCKENDKRWVIFSNGLHIEKILPYIQPYGSCLININNPQTLKKEKWYQLLNNLSLINEKQLINFFSLGINLYLDMPNYDFIFDVAKTFGYTNLRVSLVAPTTSQNKDVYYLQGKKMFLDFAEKAKQYNLTIGLDCNNVPICYFNSKELKQLNGYVAGWRTYCEPVIDIFPDFTASICFGIYQKFSLKDFSSIKEFKASLHKVLLPLIQNNYYNEQCKNCVKSKDFSCQGGCLAFSGLE